jgi:hypothetical protein
MLVVVTYWPDRAGRRKGKTMTKYTAEQLETIKVLRKMLRPGAKVYTILRSRSASGMSRCIDAFHIGKDGHKSYLTGYMVQLGIGSQSRAMWEQSKGMRINGCGMDMGYHAVYSLGRILYPDGFALPNGRIGRNGDKSGHDSDGGYALAHEWI